MSLALAIAALAIVMAGRITTFHMSEGEAMVAGWPYWLAAIALAAAFVAVERRESGK